MIIFMPDKALSLLLSLLTGLLFPAIAIATDLPSRKSGLWQIRTEAGTGEKLTPWGTMKICIVQRQDNMLTGKDDAKDLKKRCSKLEVTRVGDKIVIDSICGADKQTATSHAVITGNLQTDYHMQTTSEISPSAYGIKSIISKAEGKWLGPCKPGQRHGSYTATGMPGMKPGEELTKN